MVDRPKTIMEEWDWRIRGHKQEDYRQGRLPTKRLIIPLPETAEGVRNLYYVFNGLAKGLMDAQKGTEHIPNIIARVHDAIRDAQAKLYDHREAWEDELKARQKGELENPEHSGNVTRLGQSG